MKSLAEDRAEGQLRSLYAPIREELDEVESSLQGELRSDDPFVDRLARHGFRLGGKRLRPALLLLSGRACGPLRQEHLVLATVMELVHTATLMHDDVLDEATIRRHRDTVNARWDNEASILLGDYLLARAIEKVGALNSPFACQTIGEAARTVCEGELRQVQWRGNYDLSEEDYLGIIADKTAALTACCCRLGSYYAGAGPEMYEKLTRFGRFLGVAFQITDDLLDVIGDEPTVGKSLGTDLLKQKPTLPVIRLLVQTSEHQRQELLEILVRSENHRGEALRPWFQQSDAISYTRDKALWYARRADRELDGLPPSSACQMLKALTEFVVARRE